MLYLVLTQFFSSPNSGMGTSLDDIGVGEEGLRQGGVQTGRYTWGKEPYSTKMGIPAILVIGEDTQLQSEETHGSPVRPTQRQHRPSGGLVQFHLR